MLSQGHGGARERGPDPEVDAWTQRVSARTEDRMPGSIATHWKPRRLEDRTEPGELTKSVDGTTVTGPASRSASSALFHEYGGPNACAAARCIRTLSRRELNDTHAVGLPALSTGALTQPTRMRQGRRTRPTIRYRLAARNGLDADDIDR